jgi:uncharacterized protein (DUF2252 family)
MSGLHNITRQILAQNAGRDFERLKLKLHAMRQDPFAFFRGANRLFLGLLPRAHALFTAPRTLICGDLHFENFGAFKGDNRLVYFDVNDFDEACVAPFTLDVVRFVASIKSAAPGLKLEPAETQRLVKSFLDAYQASILDGKPRWIERSLAEGVFRALLRRAIQRSRAQLLDRFSKLKNGSRRLRIDGRRVLPLPSADTEPRLKRLLAELGADARDRRFFKLLDAGRRIAGNGSLGLERYLLLVRGRGSPDGNFALDLKFAARSAVIDWLAEPQPEQWRGDAVRVVTLQRVMQAISPALLRPVQFDGAPFVLKELQPSIDRLDFSNWRGKPKRICGAVAGMGHVAAWAHLRGCGHFGAASGESLRAYVLGRAWRLDTDRLATGTNRKMLRAFKAYAADYDSGAVIAALAGGRGPTPRKPVA